MKRQGVHRKLRDETAEWEAVITEVTPPSPGTKSEEYVRHTLTHTEIVHGEEDPGQSPRSPKYSRSRRRRQLTEPW